MTMRRDTGDRDFGELSVPEKIVRVQDLWDQIADTPDDVELTEAQRKELERRLRSHEDNPGEYTSWEELRQRLVAKGRCACRSNFLAEAAYAWSEAEPIRRPQSQGRVAGTRRIVPDWFDPIGRLRSKRTGVLPASHFRTCVNWVSGAT